MVWSWSQKTRISWLPDGKNHMFLRSLILTQCLSCVNWHASHTHVAHMLETSDTVSMSKGCVADARQKCSAFITTFGNICVIKGTQLILPPCNCCTCWTNGQSIYTVTVSKNAPTLATCSFDRSGQFFYDFRYGKQHHHTFKNDKLFLCVFNFP